jgi:protein SCO1/2
MDAMIMPYHVAAVQDLDRIQPGDTVEFTLTVDSQKSSISNIQVIPFDSADREPGQAASLAIVDQALQEKHGKPPLRVGERIPEFTLIDQTGQRVSTVNFAGKVLAITFVYTRCPLPDYCFRLSTNFERLQKRFKEQLGKDLVLISISFDPEHDTPEVLAKYGQIWKADPRTWHLLTGPPNEVKRVCRSFGVNFWPAEGVLTHSLHTMVIDRAGKLAADIEGNRFTAGQLGDLVQIYLNR